MVHGWRRTKSLLVSSSKIDFVSFVRWCGAKVNQLGWGFIELSKKVALSWPKFFQSFGRAAAQSVQLYRAMYFWLLPDVPFKEHCNISSTKIHSSCLGNTDGAAF